ncbi:MAG: hypothetical protein N2320_03105 [Candidatus Bipolaricaulota bacterium]|nr:hypothetical protein [Candidatus Bipolaricaulota bacterium]
MRTILFFLGSLVTVAIAAGVAPYPVPWRLAGGGLLLLLWAYGLAQAARGKLRPSSPVHLLPGHALLFLALGLVGAEAGRWAWLPVPVLTAALDLTDGHSLALPLYAILWLDLFALLHQVVALGRDLTGIPLLLWTVGVGAFATLYVVGGVRRRAKGVVR